MASACSTATSPTSSSGDPLRVDFYHLTHTPLDRALPRVAERIVAEGARALIVTEDGERREALDRLLWAYAPASFLPHGVAGGDDEAEQPLLIAGSADAAANGARYVVLADGVWREGALAYERVFHFFDEDRVAEARAVWRDLAGRADTDRRYWRQDDEGRWQQAA